MLRAWTWKRAQQQIKWNFWNDTTLVSSPRLLWFTTCNRRRLVYKLPPFCIEQKKVIYASTPSGLTQILHPHRTVQWQWQPWQQTQSSILHWTWMECQCFDAIDAVCVSLRSRDFCSKLCLATSARRKMKLFITVNVSFPNICQFFFLIAVSVSIFNHVQMSFSSRRIIAPSLLAKTAENGFSMRKISRKKSPTNCGQKEIFFHSSLKVWLCAQRWTILEKRRC